VRTGTLDFADPGAPAQVNAWAAEQTRGMVPRVLSSFARDERLVLADALYFDGAWTVPFDPAATAAEPFRRSDGTSRDVPMMHARGRMEHAQAGELEAIRLAYGDTGKLRFWAVAGPAGGPPAAPALDAAAWGALRARLRPAQGSLALPRLRLDADLDLRPALVALGLGPAFEPSRDLDGVLAVPGAEPIALGRVLQRARVDVDEAGTRAAAVTTITAIAVSAMVDPPAPFDLRFDRPFVWGIEAAETGTLLFVGVVEDPGTA
jgi:serpin B